VPGKIALLQFDKCNPGKCEGSVCAAMLACKKKLIRQEKPGEMPMFSPTSCVGCGDCARACPEKAVIVTQI
jgi:translation initiation factor RLI1